MGAFYMKIKSETVQELLVQALTITLQEFSTDLTVGTLCAPLFPQSSLLFWVEWASSVDFYPVFEKVVIEGMTYSVSALWTTPREDYPPHHMKI